MSATIYFFSLDPEENSQSGFSQDTIDMFIDVFSILLLDPTNTEDALNEMKSFYAQQFSQATNLSSILGITVETATLAVSNQKTVIQIDMEGNEIATTDQAYFSSAKDEAKNILGSVEKINSNEFLISDSKNKRAIIVNLSTNKISWEYNSDRYVLDAHLVPYDIAPIEISSTQYEEKEDLFVNNGKYVEWINNSAEPIYIYSGTVQESDFDTSFNLNDYGTQFKSNLLQIGEKYTYKFTDNGNFNWFSYPTVNIGKIIISEQKISLDNYFILTESDGLESAHTSQIVKVDAYGNKVLTFGEDYLVAPRDARPLTNGKIIVSV